MACPAVLHVLLFKDHVSKGTPSHHGSTSASSTVRDFLVPTLLPDGNFPSDIVQVRAWGEGRMPVGESGGEGEVRVGCLWVR